jgi:hypothetical protein
MALLEPVENAAASASDRFYSYRPSLRIQRMRLSFRPSTFQSQRFVAEIWSPNNPKLLIASTSRRGLLDEERHNAAYAAFVSELTRRVGRSGASLESGSPMLIYWIGLVIFVVTSGAMAILFVKALGAQAGWPAVIIGGFLAFFGWQTGNYFFRNRPARFSPEAIPPAVLPRT